jgi:hypothetical protein
MFLDHIVKRYQFDGSFRVAEDCEFLMRVLKEHSYVALPAVLYDYSEDANPTYSKTLAACRLPARSS